MKCHKCKRKMKYLKELKFNEYRIDGWKCGCGEIIFNPEQVQRVLLLNKLKKEAVKARLGRIRSNLILRLPKDIEAALDLKKGEDVILKVEGKGIKIVPA